ncbi:MAG: hypothetical protein V1777_03410 [Candidatus Micrarchaeota archaeon]
MTDNAPSRIMEMEKQVFDLTREISQKQKAIAILQKAEQQSDAQLQSALAKAIDEELRAVSKAEKTKSHSQAELELRLNRLKNRKTQLVQKTVVIKKLRGQQEKIKGKIEKLKSFLQKNRPPKPKIVSKKKIAAAKRVLPVKGRGKPKPVLIKPAKPLKKIKIKAKPKVLQKPKKKVSLARPKIGGFSINESSPLGGPSFVQTHREKKPKPKKPMATIPFIPKPVAPAEEPVISEPKKASSLSLEEAKEALAKAVAETKEDLADAVAETKEESLHFSHSVFSLDYPAWEKSKNSDSSALVSVEKDGFKLEVFLDETNEFFSLDESVEEFLKQNPDVMVGEKDRVLEYFFVTYTKTGLVEPMVHYSLFAKKAGQLIRVVFSGTQEQHDSYNDEILKTFKSFQLD